jgi:hypothetical protein
LRCTTALEKDDIVGRSINNRCMLVFVSPLLAYSDNLLCQTPEFVRAAAAIPNADIRYIRHNVEMRCAPDFLRDLCDLT